MDAPAATQQIPVQRVEEIWFPDGNLVIQAGSSLFRVYRGVLAARSPVFQDMLSFPQPPDSELVEGCPLVHLTDWEMEVRLFLKAIFDPEFFMPFPYPTQFATVAGCLRLSHKYGVDYLKRRALIHLSSGYDTTLDHWDTASTSNVDAAVASYIMSWQWPEDLSFAIYAIQLFREVDALWLLPTAFYNLSMYFTASLGRNVFHGTVYNGVPSVLSVQDQQSFATGHAIQCQMEREILGFLVEPVDIVGCASRSECITQRLETLGEVQRSLTLIVTPEVRSPLDVWEEEGDWEDLEEGVCETCISALRTRYQHRRQAFWERLPGMYGLPAWDVLEEMKTAAIGTTFVPDSQ
ncbi:hypothetical protein FB45DRAFT_1065530 [Roridomyces roridus]|uniref:BTB domain-containing protein n=1 Tax=Roridomyces roridus TaxID=1738132 RepID=A0AAD7B6N7_9AGAR|nr:hypothetical protein FB45DRAFT_1065530 [Roridomyces roridus]